MASLPFHTLTLVGSFTTSSYMLFSQIAGAQMGIIPILNGKVGQFNATAENRVRGWNAYFPVAMRWAIGSSITSAALSFTTAYLHPNPRIRRLSLYAGLASLAIFPFTLSLGLIPINNQLTDLGAKTLNGEIQQGEWAAKASLIEKLVQDWEKKHLVRFIGYIGSWGLNLAALLLALQ